MIITPTAGPNSTGPGARRARRSRTPTARGTDTIDGTHHANPLWDLVPPVSITHQSSEPSTLTPPGSAAAPNPTIAIRNLGPIRRGELVLRPLTVLIGPNNSGKSYAAQFAYALSRTLSLPPASPLLWSLAESVSPVRFERARRMELYQWLEAAAPAAAEAGRNLRFREIPEELRVALRGVLHEALLLRLRGSLAESLQDYFACSDIRELIRRQSGQPSLSIRLNGDEGQDPFLSLRLAARRPILDLSLNLPSLDEVPIGIPPVPFEGWSLLDRSSASFQATEQILLSLWKGSLRLKGLDGNSHYLPAARSGILQALQIYAAAAVQIVRRPGPERVEAAAFGGTTGDFLQVLLASMAESRRRQTPASLAPALELLEKGVFHGQVSVDERMPGQPRFAYNSEAGAFPLQRASSMVAELTPLDFWIKHLVLPGDLLIIDEPEAHLHPENQRLIARVLVRLVRAGVRVLCTTHSSLILHQLSNQILAKDVPPIVREEEHLEDMDLLDSSEIGVYLFDLRSDGTVVSPVPIEPGFGISEDEFVRVATAIGDQTFRLSMEQPSAGG